MTDNEIQVEEIMVRDVHTVDCESSVKETARLMADEGHGCVIVVRAQLAVGIVTERDIVHKITADAIDPSKVRVEDIMSAPVVTISYKATIGEAAEKMSVYEIRRIVVVNEHERMVGLLTAGDLAKWLAKQKNYADPTLNAIARLKAGGPYA
ncbi:MAG TPA: CBS domain-containing protein [Nitrososphaerales archaeon]|nr:CBS domain-containing protein [Nitrososphaerales archaeon]